MLRGERWLMSKEDAGEKVLTVDDGAKMIGMRCWIYSESIDQVDANGNVYDMTTEYTYGTFEELIVPGSVVTIEQRAFCNHTALRKISVLENVTKIEKNAFKGCEWLPFVVAPKVKPDSVEDPESKLKLAMGYLVNKGMYEETIAQEYEVYVKKVRSKLLLAAQKYELAEICALLGSPVSRKEPVQEKKERLSEEAAVVLLERTILTGSKAEIAEVIKQNKPFVMLARSLGFAARCRDREIVQLLLEEKADFSYKKRSQITKFGLSYKPSGTEYIADFSLLMVVENLWNPYLFGAMNKHHSPMDTKRIFSPYLNADKDISSIPEEMKMAPAQVRVANLKLLVEKKVLKPKDINRLLYYAILEEQPEMEAVLTEMGAVIDVPWLLADANHSLYSSETNQYLDAMFKKTQNSRLEVLRSFEKHLELTGQKMYVSDAIFEKLGGTVSAEIAQLLADHVDATNKKRLMESLVYQDASPAVVAVLLDKNFVKTPKQRDELIAYAVDLKRTDLLAILMDYKNRTADPEKEEVGKENDLQKSLTADPNSAAELKKKWSFKKKDDGTYILTAYRGEDTVVYVPDKVGKADVTELDNAVFSPSAKRISNAEVRRRITKIIIPETVVQIGNEAFRDCERLEEIAIPDSVRKMGTHMFTGCKNLKSVTLSQNQSGAIGEWFFSGCRSLQQLTLPKRITALDSCSFFGCTGLKEIRLGKGVKKFELCWLDKAEGLTIYAPKGCAAEKYAQ